MKPKPVSIEGDAIPIVNGEGDGWLPIGEYALIGNCRSAALVSSKGAIDWLCWPRFDSPSIFARLLDKKGGGWSIRPVGPCRSSRRYLPGTNVLETTFQGPTGKVRLLDFMPVGETEGKEPPRALDYPVSEQEIVRLLVCDEGTITMEMRYEPQPGYGLKRFKLRDWGPLGVRTEVGAELFLLQSEMELKVGENSVFGRIVLKSGDKVSSSLTHAFAWPATLFHAKEAEIKLEGTIAWWRDWLSQLHYEGPYREWVVRSALALRLLVFSPSGAVVAAPTTSLPERIGGDLNWDYRYCWLRDASMTVRSLYAIGYESEAEGFLGWMLHATRLTRPELRILYDVYGNQPKGERSHPSWSGYRHSSPVRMGNGAENQLQLDVYGEVMDAASRYRERGGHFDRATLKMLHDFCLYVCRHWELPDEGIWEPRGGRHRNTHSLVLCWAALDRFLQLSEERTKKSSNDVFRKNRSMIRRTIEQHGWNEEKGSYVSTLGGDTVDASLLQMPWYGYVEPDHPRMLGTWKRIRQELHAGDSLLYRYKLPQGRKEGAFGICSFWAVEYLASGGGSLEEAEEYFRKILTYANDVGLFAEEIAPATGHALGNFPQAFTHLGLISAALRLQDRRMGKKEASNSSREKR